MSKNIYILDAGHGGIDLKSGKYITAGKRSPIWEDGTVYYEGVGNREIAQLVHDELNRLAIANAFTVNPSDSTDVSLGVRCKIANQIHLNNKKRGVLISIHSNAASIEAANGFEVYTSPGQTTSDTYADIWYKEMSAEFPKLKGRPDTRDGDYDKEASFQMLTGTNCPAFLIETMFHTNKSECAILMSPEGKRRIAKVIVRTIQKIEQLS